MQRSCCLTPSEALARLNEGNKRFVAGRPVSHGTTQTDRHTYTTGQSPFAAIIACSDSRVPPEIVFDSGIGELFVIRTAGNVLDTAGTGSLLYAIEHLACPLVIVLGHESCGAVTAALSSDDELATESKAIRDLVSIIRANIPDTLAGPLKGIDRLEAATEENMRTTVDVLRNMSTLRKRIDEGSLSIITAYYPLESGAVVFGQEAD